MMNLDVAILRHEPFGDVHVRHDFDARNQRGMELFGRRRLFLQQTVDPVAQLEAFPRTAPGECRSPARAPPSR